MSYKRTLTIIILIALILGTTPTVHATPTSIYDATKNYVLDRYDDENGVFYYDPDSELTNMESVFSSVAVLYFLDTLEDINTTQVAIWINSTINTENVNDTDNYGGFAENPGMSPSVSSTYYAVLSLWYLDKLNTINTTLVAEWINRTKNINGGYSDYPGENPTLISTYYAVSCLHILEKDEYIDSQEILDLLISLQITNNTSQDYGGFKGNINETTASLDATYAAVNLLNLLDSISETNASAVVQYILTKEANDAFSYQAGLPPDLLSTYWAISALSIVSNGSIGNLIDTDAVVSWILSLQNEDGGFRLFEENGDSSLYATAIAIMTLFNLNSMDVLGNQVPWEKGGLTYLYVFLIIIFGTIGLLILVAYLKAKYQKY